MRDWVPVTIGRSGAEVSRRADVYRKRSVDPDHDLVGEAERLVWLREHGLPAPEVLESAAGLLVTRAVPGRSAAEPWPSAARPAVVDALARITRRLHALPTRGCPFDRRLAVSVAEAERAAPDLDDLDAERHGWSRDRLIRELRATRPASEDVVVCHGDLSLPNVVLDPTTCEVTGLVDVGRLGLADRWVDLAIVTRSLASAQNPQFGPWAAERYLAAYDIVADAARLAFYRLLDEFV